MGRRANRVPVRLNTNGIKRLPEEDIRAILRGAEELIMCAGRNLLVKLLKGSRAKEVLERDLQECPVYGHYRQLKVEEVQARVDWCIAHGYLAIQYDWRLPLLAFTWSGWDIVRQTLAEEHLHSFDEMIATDSLPQDLSDLREESREVVMLLLDLIEKSDEAKYLPILEIWHRTDYRKVCKRIRQVMQSLRTQDSSTVVQEQRAQAEPLALGQMRPHHAAPGSIR